MGYARKMPENMEGLQIVGKKFYKADEGAALYSMGVHTFDSKGYSLRMGESQRADGRYCFSFLDKRGIRQYRYAKTLVALRDIEKAVRRDMDDGLEPGQIERLTAPQQQAFMDHLRSNYQFHGWEPIITVLLGTGMRIGECLGLCWDDLDFKNRMIKVRKTLTYRPEPENGCVVHISTPKIEAGERIIPMIDEVYDAFLEEYQIQKVLGFGTNEIDGYKDFIFSSGAGNVYTPESVNRAIKRIYEDYNTQETKEAEKEHREPFLLPHFSAHHFLYQTLRKRIKLKGNPVCDGTFGYSDNDGYLCGMHAGEEKGSICYIERKNHVVGK